MPACGLTLGRIIAATLWLLAETGAVSLSGKPPRLSVCREIMKAKDSSEVFLVSNSFSCQNITFPCSAPAFPDTRNCENYYKCESLTITQCPCDPGETFNVATQSCDKSAAACECPSPTMPATQSAISGNTTQASVVAEAATTTIAGPAATTPPPHSTAVADAAASGRPGAGPSTATAAANGGAAAPAADTPAPVVEAQLPAGGAASAAAPAAQTTAGTTAAAATSQRPGGDVAKTVPPLQSSADAAIADARSETSIIIAAIVCGSGVTVAVIGTVVYLCHTSRFRIRKDAKLPGLPCGEASGYTQPGVERHLYHEIDDRTMGSTRSFIYRAQPQLQPPPLPTTQPPPAHARPCALCLDGSGDSTVPAPGTVKKHFPATNPHYRLGIGGGGGGGSAELHYGSASAFAAVAGQQQSHSRESSSDCSLYSGGSSSNQSTLESFTDSGGSSGRGSDMRAPLNAQLAAAKSAYVSKQVYI